MGDLAVHIVWAKIKKVEPNITEIEKLEVFQIIEYIFGGGSLFHHAA
jgi:hypothetical protein